MLIKIIYMYGTWIINGSVKVFLYVYICATIYTFIYI